MDHKVVVKKLFSGKDLCFKEASSLFAALFEEDIEDSTIASVLVALAIKGETPEEVAAAIAEANRRKIKVPISCLVVDTCGTGGDGAGTFNISTASAFVLKALGVRVAKHGNRSVTSKVGSADIVEFLGIPILTDPQKAKSFIEKEGFAFLFAPYFHPAFKRVAPVRKKLGIPTIFNILGPMINPADPYAQLIGFYSVSKMEVAASALRLLGVRNRVLVSSEDGLDEVSTEKPTKILELRDGKIKSYTFNASKVVGSSFPVPRVSSKEEALSVFFNAINGEDSEASKVVALNTAFALYAAGVADVDEGYKMALNAIKEKRVFSEIERLKVELPAEDKKA